MKDNLLNSKGMTLIEIILSIGLVSIIMVQVLTILVDLKDEQVLGEDKTTDLTNRSIIVKTVNSDFINHNIFSIDPCPASSAKLADYTLKSCLKIRFEDQQTKPRFLITARDRFNKNDYFIYGYSENTKAKVPDATSYEAWKLSIGRYPKYTGGFGASDAAKSCGFVFTVYPTDITANVGTSRYIRIAYPVELDNAYSNTMMTFDLEFIYYYRGGSNDIIAAVHNDITLDTAVRGVFKYLKDSNRCTKGTLTYK